MPGLVDIARGFKGFAQEFSPFAPQQGFGGSMEEQIMNLLLQQARASAEEQTSGVLGRVGRSVSGRGFLAPPGEGRGVLGALQTRAAVPIQRGLQRQETGIRTGALGSFSQRLQQDKQMRMQMFMFLKQLEAQKPGFLDKLLGGIQGFGAVAPFIFPGAPPV